MARDPPLPPKPAMSPGYHGLSTAQGAPIQRHPYYAYGSYPPTAHLAPLPMHPPPSHNHDSSTVSGGNIIHHHNQQHHSSLTIGQPSPFPIPPSGPNTNSYASRGGFNSTVESKSASPSQENPTRATENTKSTGNASSEHISQHREQLPHASAWHPLNTPYAHAHSGAPPLYGPDGQWGGIVSHHPHHHNIIPPPYHTQHWGQQPPPLVRYPGHPPPPSSHHAVDSRVSYWPNNSNRQVVDHSHNFVLGAVPTSSVLSGSDNLNTAVVNRAEVLRPTILNTNYLPITAATSSSDRFNNDVDGREGATSPSQIEVNHRDEVQHMGCTCKKTLCLKLYCQCFAIKIYCGENCRCLACFNNKRHEKKRKEAMRSILSRNPSAFDTKFKKTGQNISIPAVTAAAVQVPDSNRILAHKLGCKCRKSNCMKKYCECYAASVKCNSTCRCVACKNRSGSHIDYGDKGSPREDEDTSYSVATHPAHFPLKSFTGPPAPPYQTNLSGEPWAVAQSLAFMKRSSPASKIKMPPTALESSSTGITSMPSLTSSSDGTSPGEANSSAQCRNEEDEDNAMLLAAVAMTEFIQSPPPKQSTLDYTATPQSQRYTENTNDNSAVPSAHGFGRSPAVSKFFQQAEVSSSPASSYPSMRRSLEFDYDEIEKNSKKARIP